MSKKTAYKRRDGRWECRISMGKDIQLFAKEKIKARL